MTADKTSAHPRRWRRRAVKISIGLVTAVALMISVRATGAEVFYVPTGVVAPEIPRGSRVLVYKLGSTYKPGQIVAYRDGEMTLLGRVAEISPTGEIVADRNAGTVVIDPGDVIGHIVLNTRP